MKKTILLTTVCAAGALTAAPRVEGTPTIDWNAATHVLTVGYELADGPGIVTLSLQTNAPGGAWVAVDDARVTRLAGDVNRVTASGANKTISWTPDDDWPEALIAEGGLRAVLTVWSPSAPPPYMVADLRYAGVVRYYATTNALPGGLADARYKRDYLLMRKIEANEVVWKMGCPDSQPGAKGSGWDWTLETRHQVTLRHDYYIGVFELTIGQYATVMNGSRPGSASNEEDADECPVDKVSPSTILTGNASFIARLRTATGRTDFTLPTSAEWEYACRAGHGTGLYTGEEISDAGECSRVDALAWYYYNSGDRVHPVGRKAPNAWGLYDMLGNVDEMTRDHFVTDLGSAAVVDPEYPEEVPTDPGSYRFATCGGSIGRNASRIRCSCRNSLEGATKGYGFRVSCSVGGNRE